MMDISASQLSHVSFDLKLNTLWDEKGGRKPTPLSTQNDEEYILLFLLSERDRSLGQERGRFWRDVADLTFDDVAYEHMNLMLDALGLDRTTTMKRMEEIQPYVEGLCQCYRDDNNPRRKGMRWLTAIHKSKPHTVDEAYPLCFAPIEDEQSLAVVRTVELKRQSRRRETFRYCFFCSSEPSLLRVLSSDRAVKESMRHLTSHGVVHPRGEKGLEEHVCATNLVPAISKIVANGTDVELKCREEEDVGSG